MIELNNGRGEIKGAGALDNVVLAQAVADHELSEITHNLGRRSDLDDVTAELVGIDVSPLDVGPLRSETQRGGLEEQVGELTTGNLSGENGTVAGFDYKTEVSERNGADRRA